MKFSSVLLAASMVGSTSAYSQSATCTFNDFSLCSNIELIRLITNNLDESTDSDIEQVMKIEAELVKRHASKEAIEYFNEADSLATSASAYRLIAALRSETMDAAIRPAANDELTLKAYEANMYFAEKGKTFALDNLNKNYYRYEIPSFVWAETVLLFGKYKYFPANENLISTVNAAEENLAEASVDSLEMLYPKTKDKVEGLGSTEKIIEFYTNYIKKH